MSIVIWVQHGLGDLIMALPLIRFVNSKLKKSDRLILIVKGPLQKELVETCIDLHRKSDILMKSKYSLYKLLLKLRRIKADFNLCVHLSPSLKCALFTSLTKSKFAVGPKGKWSWLGYNKTVKEIGQHKVEYYFSYANCAGFDGKFAKYLAVDTMRIKIKHSNAFDKEFYPRVIITPGSAVVEKHKLWPNKNFSNLINMLCNKYEKCQIILLGALFEKYILDQILKKVSTDYTHRVKIKLVNTIIQSMSIMSDTDVLVSTATGNSHLGSICGCRIVEIYGPSNPGFTGAYSEKLYPVRLGLKCSPCYRLGFDRGCGDPVCMTGISTDMVFNRLEDALAKKRTKRHPYLKVTNSKKPILN